MGDTLALVSHRKNKAVRRNALSFLVSIMGIDEIQKALIKQSKVDVLSKLIGIVEKVTL